MGNFLLCKRNWILFIVHVFYGNLREEWIEKNVEVLSCKCGAIPLYGINVCATFLGSGILRFSREGELSNHSKDERSRLDDVFVPKVSPVISDSNNWNSCEVLLRELTICKARKGIYRDMVSIWGLELLPWKSGRHSVEKNRVSFATSRTCEKPFVDSMTDNNFSQTPPATKLLEPFPEVLQLQYTFNADTFLSRSKQFCC